MPVTSAPPVPHQTDTLAGQRRDPALHFAGWLARLMDDAHLDPILGLVLPGIGDFAASALGLSLVAIAWKRRMPPVIIARMLLNLAVDAGLGAIPILGDIFDWYFKANTRNLRLLHARSATGRSKPIDWLILAGAAVAFCVAMALPIVALIYFVGWIRQPGG
jgi:hypothetical protein